MPEAHSSRVQALWLTQSLELGAVGFQGFGSWAHLLLQDHVSRAIERTG
jgi:hypothetical protein